ncbi:helix-turn-helix transcriptional regulator [Nocardia sp. NPDC004604]|uniref:helix-turn-helix domain-containing protein n=1 Tax=Nocardia sp. NPDC004604 TaxID=3157013 RepID=UPI0033BCE0B3
MPVPEASLSPQQRKVRKMRRDAVGAAIRRAREAAKMNQDELAAASGVSRPVIARIELGNSGVQIDRLWDLAEALATTPSALLADAEQHLSSSNASAKGSPPAMAVKKVAKGE